MRADDERRQLVVSHAQLGLAGVTHCFLRAGVQVYGDAERLKPFAENAIMLLGQNLRRREHDHAEAALDRPQRGTGGNGGFAGADVAL